MQLSKRGLGVQESATLAISGKAKAMMAKGIDVVNFGVGEPDFDTPQHIVAAAHAALDAGMTRYTPAAGTPALRRAVCDAALRDYGLAVTPQEVVVSGGAKAALYNTMMALLDVGDEIIIPTPCWVSYPEMARLCGAVPVTVYAGRDQGFLPTLAQLRAAITDKTRVILINNPCNPTGAVYSEELLRGIAALAEEFDLWVIADEIYDQLMYEGKAVSFAALSESARQHAVIVNGASKSYAMTGWRIGWTIAPAPCSQVIANIQSQDASCPNSIAQQAVQEALLACQGERGAMRAQYSARRDYLLGAINAIDGLSAFPPAGAFYLFVQVSALYGKKLGDTVITDSLTFASLLLEDAGVAVVPGEPFGDDDHVRLCFALGQDALEKGVQRIAAFVEKLN